MTRKLLLFPLLIFGCSMTPMLSKAVGQMIPKEGQSIMESPKASLPVSDNGTAVIAEENVFMRAAPESDGRIITTLYFGDVVRILGKAGGWLMVINDTHVGYVWSGCFVGYSGGCR